MEVAAPIFIHQVKGKWEVRINGGDKWVPYYNGMRIDPESRTHWLAE